jgi:NADH-quinone oxidoreductase subunit E
MPRFTDETKARIDEMTARYPTRKSALLPALWVAQEVYDGWLPEEAMQEVADHLGISRAEVEGVASYYTMYNKERVGKHHIEICHNISCMILGADDLIHHCEHRLGITHGETTPDGLFTLSRVECLGACCNAVAVQVGGRYHEDVRTPAQMDALIEQLRSAPVSGVERPEQARMPEQDRF